MTEAAEAAPRDMVRTLPFWLIFVASTLGGITNSASTPIIPVYVEDTLGGDSSLAGAIVALAALASVIAMPIAGAVADRRGYRLITVVGGGIAVVGMLLLAALPTLAGAGVSRVLFGLGNAAAMTVIMAWLIALTPANQRGRALSYFGLSVWLGVALGRSSAPRSNSWAGHRSSSSSAPGSNSPRSPRSSRSPVLAPPPSAPRRASSPCRAARSPGSGMPFGRCGRPASPPRRHGAARAS